MICFECSAPADHRHHVVPKIIGGTKTVPLCAACHGKIHDRRMVSTSALTRRAMRHKQEQGEYIGGRVPYGFRLVGGELVEHDAEQRVIAEARSLRDSGLSLRAVARELANRGFKTRTGREFAAQQVKRLMSTRHPKP